MTHTPGPWTTEAIEVPDAGSNTIVCTKGQGTYIADTYADPRNGAWARWQESVANALLIAATPDLLEACRKALTCRASMNGDVVDLIRAAIAKAEGREP